MRVLLLLFLPMLVSPLSTFHDEEAEQLLKSFVNLSADPCDDFYNFACGGFIASHEVIPGKGFINRQAMINDTIEPELRELLEGEEDFNSTAIRKVQQFYRSCLDETAVETERNFLANNSMNLTTMLALSNALKVPTFILAYVNEATKVGSEAFIGITSLPSLLSITMMTTTDAENATIEYKEAMERSLAIYKTEQGLDFLTEDNRRDADDVFEFDQKLQNIQPAAEKDKELKLSELKEQLTLIDWDVFFNLIASEDRDYFDSDPYLRVIGMSTLKEIMKILESTPMNVIKNYYAVFVSSARDLAFKKQYSMLTDLFGAPAEPRWKRCLENTKLLSLNNAVDSLYVRNSLKDNTKADVETLTEKIRNTYIKMLETNPWMDAETREKAIVKAKKTLVHIGYSDWITNNTALDEYYREIDIEPSDRTFGEILVKWSLLQSGRLFHERLQPLNRSLFCFGRTSAATFQGYESFNTISIGAPMLHPPYYSEKYPKYMQYGGIGTVIGHELAHAFAVHGNDYDENGVPGNWWSMKTHMQFHEMRRCLIAQYDEQIVPEIGVHLNGIFTSAEDIADDGGVKSAFRAYLSYLKEHGSEPAIPGFEEYSNEQMFFIAHAQVYCSKETPEFLRDKVEKDVHSPFRYRVNVPLSQQKEFSEAFNCPADAKMNARQKCTLW